MNLNPLFRPRSIALLGATDKAGSEGQRTWQNLLCGGFKGRLFAVNPKYEQVGGQPCYADVADLPQVPDLAISVLPARRIVAVARRCADLGVKALLLAGHGYDAETLRRIGPDLAQLCRQSGLRLLGPNSVGYINTAQGICAISAEGDSKAGKIAVICDSRALCATMLDWGKSLNIGFSFFISSGEELDTGLNDLIDFLGNDPRTACILLYMEGLQRARKFISAARAFSRHKPIVVLKAGRSTLSERAAFSHTGKLTGDDAAYTAAFRRSGIIRVDAIEQLFDVAKAIVAQRYPEQARLAIVSNASGGAMLATDHLLRLGGEAACLADESLAALDALGDKLVHARNPFTLKRQASAGEFADVVGLCLKDEHADAVLAVLSAQDAPLAEAIADELIQINRRTQKLLLVTCLGLDLLAATKQKLEAANIPTYFFPESAVFAFVKLHNYRRYRALLYATPGSTPTHFSARREAARQLIREVRQQGRRALNEWEAKKLLSCYDIPITRNQVTQNKAEALDFAQQIGYPVILKVLSAAIQHKTEVGAIALNVRNADDLSYAYDKIRRNALQQVLPEDIQGILVEEKINIRHEVFVGAKKHPIFGPVILFGMGGIAVEVFKDINVALPPLNMALAEHLIAGTKMYHLLKGFRGMAGSDLANMQFLLYKVSYMLVDLPSIEELDINPIAINDRGGIALDASILLSERPMLPTRNYAHLSIAPYPEEYTSSFVMKNGRMALLRPIRPEDEDMEAEMIAKFSERTQRFRFFGTAFDVNHDFLARFVHIDYDREMAIVAEVKEGGKRMLAGVVRIVSDAYNESAEYAIAVADPWHGLGLGSKLTDVILDIARDRGIKKVYATLLKANKDMHRVFTRKGFVISADDVDTYHAELWLDVTAGGEKT